MLTTKPRNGIVHIRKNYSTFGIINGLREKIEDTTLPVYQSIVHIGNASGTVVARDKVLSAAHTIELLSVGDLVIPALNGSQTPYGIFAVTQIEYPQEWRPSHGGVNSAYDYAIATIAPNEKGQYIGDVVPPLPIKLTVIDDLDRADIEVGMPVELLGYPHSEGYTTLCSSPGKLLRDDGKYYQYSEDLGLGDHFLAYDADASWGNSGGPVLNCNNEIIGVVTLDNSNSEIWGEDDWGNGAVMMDRQAYGWIISRLR